MSENYYFRPRRGKKATACSQDFVLRKGEVFFEVPDLGVGKGPGKIKMGDGITRYSLLPYFYEPPTIDPSTNTITFEESETTDNTELLNTIASGAQLATIIGAIKKLLRNHNDAMGDQVTFDLSGTTLTITPKE